MNNKTLFTPIKVIGLLTIFSFLLPIFKIGGFGMKLDLLLLFPLCFLIFLKDTKVRKQQFFVKVFTVTFLVFLSMFISDMLGEIHSGSAEAGYFPTEYINFVSKVFIMYAFFVIGEQGIISEKLFLNSVTVIFAAALVFGLLQAQGVSFASGLTEVYASTENQVSKISRESLRIFSTTGNVLTWAGWSGFIFVFSLIVYKNNLLKWTMLLLSSANLLFTSSRGAIIAVFVAVLFYFVFRIYKMGKFSLFFKYLVLAVAALLVLGYVSMYFFEERIMFFIDRFYYLNDAIFESGRNVQLKNIWAVFSQDTWNYLFGIGKSAVDSIGLMEIELFFILFSYGIVGVFFQYSFVYLVIKKSGAGKLNMYSEVIIAGIIFYLVYSSGYFFLKEIYSGLLFWSVVGYFLSKAKYEK